jgi:hypothetical protein
MQRSIAARNEIGPLLEALIVQLEAEGSATQRAWFTRIRRILDDARDELDLADPIRALSTSAVVGFQFSSDADARIARILEKAEQVARDLEAVLPTWH